jgi:serine/threonine-protein kinase
MAAPLYHLYLFASIALRRTAEAVPLSLPSKLAGLLAYLALSPAGAFQRRDKIVALFWPELDQAHSRAALRKAVHALRSLLGAGVIVSHGREAIGIAAEALWCDAVEFASATEDGRLERALELYRGELMPGFHLSGCADYDRWLEDERLTARARAGAAAWGLARQHEQNQRLTTAGNLARRAMSLQWGDERILRRTLELLLRIGDRAGAMHLYEEFAKRLKADLEIDPSVETQLLIQRLKSVQPRE